MTERRVWEIPVLLAVAGVALALRFVRLDLGWFGVDQARDIAIALDIVEGRTWPLVGPTMRRVTRLGVLYHYFWALPYVVWRDPMAGYWFAACLSASAVLLTWRIARRLWGPAAGIVSALVAAAHPVWVIDGRVCWAPAALPCVAALLTWLALGRTPAREPLSARRAALIGALLGLAVQLHLTMVGWVLGFVILAVLDRLPLRALAAALAAGAVVGAPALWAMFGAGNAEESGIATLPSRAPHAPLALRLEAMAMLPRRLLAAFGDASASDLIDPLLAVATVLVAIVVAAGVLRLCGRAFRGDRGARVVLLPAGITALLILWLPGDAWYYYLDSVLPVAALAAGALIAPGPEGSARRFRSSRVRDIGRAAVAASAAAACLVFALATGGWLARVAAAGYIATEPSGLTLDGNPRRDLVHPGRLTTVAVKRQAAAVAAALGGDFESLWLRVHGPAFADATGDNGFWFRWSLARTAVVAAESALAGADTRHLAFWYRDDATAVRLLSADVERVTVGPLLAVRYTTFIDYASCRDEAGPVTVPIRVPPDPRRYGDGTPALPATLPPAVTCRLRRNADPRAPGAIVSSRPVVAALGGDGDVTITVEGTSGRAREAPGGAVCVSPVDATAVRLTIARRTDAPADLDFYDVPLAAGCDDASAPAGSER